MTLRERIQEWLENTSDSSHDDKCVYWQNDRCDCDRSGARPLLREVLDKLKENGNDNPHPNT